LALVRLSSCTPSHGWERTDRHGKAYARRGPAGADDLRIHADDLSRKVEKWSSRVPGVDGGIGLDGLADEPVVLRALNDPSQRTDHAGGQRLLQSKGVAYGDHELPHAQAVRITKR
jgi:hypothetical protein